MNTNLVWLFILFVLAGGQLAACRPLVGTDWTLTSLNGHELIPETVITGSINDERLVGFAGCNHYGTSIEIKDDTLVFDEELVATTEFYCVEPEGNVEQEKEYVTALVSVVTFTLSERRLEMKNADGDVVLVFTKGLPEDFPR